MKKNFKRTLAKVMAVALTVSLVGTAADADAAKKIKLSKKSITVTKGKSKKVTIKNVKAKKVKKLTVKTTKKKVATVKKAGKTAFKVTGKKVGSAKIKVTLKLKGKKKATKLTLKVKVKKAAPKVSTAPATTAAASVAPATTTAPAPATTTAPTDVTTPEPTAPATPEPTATTPAGPLTLALTADMAPAWVTAGSYGTTVFNEDGTVSFDSTPSAADTEGSVYNNGLAFYLNASKDKTDISGYKYVAIKVATDAELKLMTWSGGSDAESFWDKKDTWGGQAAVSDNGDGTKTVYYAVADVFASEGKKSKSIGFTLKSDLGGDDSVFAARTATLYSIELLTEMPAVQTPAPTPVPTENPFTEGGIMLDMATAFNADLSDVDVTATKDENGYAVTKLNFSGNYQRVFFDLPEDVDASKIAKIEVLADVPAQLASSLFQNDFSKDADSWWNLAKVNGYPFYAGSGTRDEEGGLVERGIELNALDASAAEITGMGGFFSLGGNGKPDEDADDGGFGAANYYIYGINIVLKETTPEVPGEETPGEETPEVETPEVPGEETPEVETEEVVDPSPAPTVEPTDAPAATPAVYAVNKDIVYDATEAAIDAWAGNKGATLDSAITVKATDTVTALVEVVDSEGNAVETSMQLYLCSDANNYYGSRVIGTSKANIGEAVALTDVVTEIDGEVEIVALYTNNAAAVAEGDVVTMTVKTITVTPAE